MPRPDYLLHQLKLDPRAAAARIVALRNAELGLDGPDKIDSRSLQSRQAVVSARTVVDSLRQQFWTLPLEQLQAQLAAINVKPFPELATVVERLQQAAGLRSQFPRLAQRLGDNLGLFHCIKQSLTMPPRDVAGMKESVMRSLLSGEKNREYKAVALLVKQEFPDIYALEHEWFDDILKTNKLSRRVGTKDDGKIFGMQAWVFFFLVVLLIRGCAAVMR
ncbi:MAG: hypothetical protein IT423_06885 [Pirellulaceae bacterium]|nr:hypothetical protein [Pirellulaceae bacterium]